MVSRKHHAPQATEPVTPGRCKRYRHVAALSAGVVKHGFGRRGEICRN